MMTDIDIKDDIFNLIKDSELAKSLSGQIYKTGVKPLNSKKEDCVINIAGNQNGEIQRAIVNVNIHVPDLYIAKDKTWVEDTKRLRVLCKLAEQLFTSKRVKRMRKVELESQRVFADQGNEHFINNRILFNIYNP